MINKLSEIILKFVFNFVVLTALSWITCQIIVDLLPYLPGGFVFYLKTLYIYKIFNCRLPIPRTVPLFILFLMRHITSNYIETVIDPVCVCRLQIPRDWNAFERAAGQGWEENPELGDDAPQPPADVPQPPADAPQPPADAPQPPADMPQPPADMPQPPADAPQPPANAPQPPANAPQPQPPADAPQPPTDAP